MNTQCNLLVLVPLVHPDVLLRAGWTFIADRAGGQLMLHRAERGEHGADSLAGGGKGCHSRSAVRRGHQRHRGRGREAGREGGRRE
eukprot:scaffold256722_cov35-Tisochrysis_lutea.AAC.1